MPQSPVAYTPSPRAMAAAASGMRGMRPAAASEDADADDEASEAFPYSLDELVTMFEDSEEATQGARKISERCRDYYDNKQLTAEEIAELQKRGQPEIIRNQIKAKVNFWLGFEAKNRTDPKAYPNNEDDEDAAGYATDLLRFQERKNDLDQKFSDVWENMLIEGYGGIEVLGPSARDKAKIEVKRWKWDRLFYDPASSEHDFEDATYKGGVVWMDRDKAIRKWPKAKLIVDGTISSEVGLSSTYEDKPRKGVWATRGKRVRVRIVQIYCYDGEQWYWAIFTKGGIIDKGAVAFVDEHGYSVCPLILQALYVDRDNNRYGEVYEFLWTQDEINKRASKALHLLNSTQTYGEQGAAGDIDKVKAEKAKPDGHIELPAGGFDKFKFVDHDAKIAQNREMMNDAVLAMEKRGPNASLMGTQSNAPSGRAIRANQEGGIIEGARPRDRRNALVERTYRAIWQRCRQFITEEIAVRITDDEDSVRFVGFNRQMTMGDKLVEDAQKQGMPEEEINQRLQMLAADPRYAEQLDQVITVNVPAEMDVDIDIELSTESVNMQQEMFEAIAGRQDIPLPIIIEMMPGPPKQKKKLKTLLEQYGAQQGQAQQEAALVNVDNIKSKTELNRASAMQKMADAEQTDTQTQLTPVESAHAMRRADADATQRAAQASQGAA